MMERLFYSLYRIDRESNVSTVGWAQIAAFEDVATAGSSAVNAAVLLERAARSRGPRRAAALLLASLFAGIAVGALEQAGADDSGVVGALLSGPLLTANLAVTAVLALGARR
jgi:hypothetical protein